MHWREPLLGNHQAQLFLHYTDNNGIFAEENTHFDGRPIPGIPKPDIYSVDGLTFAEIEEKFGFFPTGSKPINPEEKEALLKMMMGPMGSIELKE